MMLLSRSSALILLRSTCSSSSSSTSSTSCGASMLSATVLRSASSDAARQRRLRAFEHEREQQQLRFSNNVEKVIISVQQKDEDERNLLMNNHLSTYHDCAKHISRLKANNMALARVITETGEQFVSPHTPINGNAKLDILEFNNAEFAEHINKAYWRSCAFLLGALAETSFKMNVSIIGALPPDVESGRFVYAAFIDNLRDWKPTKLELDALSQKVRRDLISKAHPFIPLRVPRTMAAELFADNQTKVDSILNDSDEEEITLCKIGDHVDIAQGALIANTRQIGRYEVTGIDYVNSQYHFCGVSLPYVAKCTSYSWDLLVEAARSPSPSSSSSQSAKLLDSGVERHQNEARAFA